MSSSDSDSDFYEEEDEDMALTVRVCFHTATAGMIWDQFFAGEDFPGGFEPILQARLPVVIDWIQDKEIEVFLEMVLQEPPQPAPTINDFLAFFHEVRPLERYYDIPAFRNNLAMLLRVKYLRTLQANAA
jgi:hypothetical protein